MHDKDIDPTGDFLAATRESQGQPVDAVGRAWGDRDDDLSPAIIASHPVNSRRHDTYHRAMELVGNRHSKSSLVALVNHLLIQADHAEKDARIAELEADAKDASDYIDQLNVLCEDFGCEAGSNRLFWLHERLTTLTASRAECEGLRVALEFYADISKYPAPSTGGMGALWSDCGQIARAALSQKELGR